MTLNKPHVKKKVSTSPLKNNKKPVFSVSFFAKNELVLILFLVNLIGIEIIETAIL